MNINKELIKKCVALDKDNMGDNFRDGNGNPIDWNNLENIIARSLRNGAILKTVLKQEVLKGYFLYRIRERNAFIFSIQVLRPGENPFLLKELLKIAILELESTNFDLVFTSVDKKNKKSLALHRKLGFKLSEEKETSLSFSLSRMNLLNRLITLVNHF